VTTRALTRANRTGRGTMLTARNGTGPEMSGPSRSRLDESRSQRETPRTTPTVSARREDAVAILPCLSTTVRADAAPVTQRRDDDDALRRELAAGWPRWGQKPVPPLRPDQQRDLCAVIETLAEAVAPGGRR